MNVQQSERRMHEIRSLYGRERIDVLLTKYRDRILIVDKERAKRIFRLAEPRLSAALKSLDYDKTITDFEQTVNTQNKKVFVHCMES